MTKQVNCCLCSQILGRKEGDLISEMLREREYVRRVPLENDLFALVPSLGPVVPGHTLLCPKHHLRSFAELWLDGPDERNTLAMLLDLKVRATRILRSIYGFPVHTFEHGSAITGARILCSVEHAHLHLLPTDADIRSTVVNDSRWVPVGSESVRATAAAAGREYLYYEDPNGAAFLATTTSGFESQYMRRLFASALGNDSEWNWREHPKVDATVNAFRAFVTAVG
jgi:ATP adenylyltransferase